MTVEEVIIKVLSEPEMKDVALIEGLPGVGNVGKVALDHVIKELKPELFAKIYSKNLPPQVLLDDDGITSLVSQNLYHLEKDGKHFVLLAGEYQGADSRGQYELAYELLSFLQERYGISEIFTLGGYGLGKMLEEPRVLGAATSEEMAGRMKEAGAVFLKGEPSNGIIGASGILLGIGKELFGVDGGCLMGETSGYIVDSRSGRNVLEVLMKLTGIEVSTEELEIQSEETQKILDNLREMAESSLDEENEDLRYIG